VPWFKVDDGFWSHPKVAELTNDAVALWVRAGSYASQHLTDGKVTVGTLRMLASSRETADELVLAGLWDQVDSKTWLFHDWATYQPSREEVLKERDAAAERKRKSRQKSRGESQRDMPVTDGVSPPSPTRPDPTRPFSTSDEVEKPLSPFCYQHPTGTDKACKRCANARLVYEASKQAEKTKPTPVPKRAPECELHPNWPLPCDKCRQIAAETAA
jgi:hypothetical protein